MKYITKLYSWGQGVHLQVFSKKGVHLHFIIFALLNWNLTFTKLQPHF
jgi:hypothetical protein